MNIKSNNEILVGKVRKNHGLKGMLRVSIISENWEQIWKNCYIRNNDEIYKIEDKSLFNKHHNEYLIRVCNIDSIDSARFLVNSSIFIKEIDSIENNEPILNDIIDKPLMLNNMKILGKIHSLMNFGGEDLLKIIDDKTSKEFFVPFDFNMFEVSKDCVFLKDSYLNYFIDYRNLNV
jgi:16S rRNA processing protein RimM